MMSHCKAEISKERPISRYITALSADLIFFFVRNFGKRNIVNPCEQKNYFTQHVNVNLCSKCKYLI